VRFEEFAEAERCSEAGRSRHHSAGDHLQRRESPRSTRRAERSLDGTPFRYGFTVSLR
jgi:hypothetical protein